MLFPFMHPQAKLTRSIKGLIEGRGQDQTREAVQESAQEWTCLDCQPTRIASPCSIAPIPGIGVSHRIPCIH